MNLSLGTKKIPTHFQKIWNNMIMTQGSLPLWKSHKEETFWAVLSLMTVKLTGHQPIWISFWSKVKCVFLLKIISTNIFCEQGYLLEPSISKAIKTLQHHYLKNNKDTINQLYDGNDLMKLLCLSSIWWFWYRLVKWIFGGNSQWVCLFCLQISFEIDLF